MHTRLKITVIGVGAMGSLFAGRLAPYADVCMIGHWPAQLAAVKASGLRVCHPDGRQTVHAVLATDDVRRVVQVDAVIVLVKHHQTKRAACQAAQILAPDGVVVTLQNGLGNLSRIADVVGSHRATLGVTPQGAMLMAPGADSLVWGKLAVNAGVNPLTALLGVPNGFVAEHAAARAVVGRAATEVAAVAQAQGITLPYADAGQYAIEAARATAVNQSSRWQDVRRGAPTEIEAMCGAIVRAGQAHGVATPVNALLYSLMKQQEHGEPTMIGAWGTSLADADTITLINGLLTQACTDAV